MIERREIPSWPGYYATSDGKVVGRRYNRPLKPFLRPDGYLQLILTRDGHRGCVQLQAVVCEAFHGPKPTPSHEAAHFDGDQANCRPENLRWATKKENKGDMVRHGTWVFGEKHHRAKVTQAQVDEVRRRYAAQRSGAKIARGARLRISQETGVPLYTVKQIMSGKAWSGIPSPPRKPAPKALILTL